MFKIGLKNNRKLKTRIFEKRRKAV